MTKLILALRHGYVIWIGVKLTLIFSSSPRVAVCCFSSRSLSWEQICRKQKNSLVCSPTFRQSSSIKPEERFSIKMNTQYPYSYNQQQKICTVKLFPVSGASTQLQQATKSLLSFSANNNQRFKSLIYLSTQPLGYFKTKKLIVKQSIHRKTGGEKNSLSEKV